MKKENYGGVNAAKSENYDLRYVSTIKEHSVEDPKWATPKANLILLPIFSIMDGMVLFSIFDACLTQSVAMGIIMAFGVAVVINVLPLIIAKFLHQAIYKIKRHALTMVIVFTSAFFLMFISTVVLRFAYSDMYGEERQTMQLENTVSNTEDTTANDEDVDSEKSLAVVLLLSLSPLITSIIGFGIAYIGDDEVRRKVEFYEKRDVELDEAISDLEAAIETMDNDVERDLKLDEDAMKASIKEIEARCDILKAQARHYLAEFLSDPSATTKLSNEMLVSKEEKSETRLTVAENEFFDNIREQKNHVA